jgi:hypothetical protein
LTEFEKLKKEMGNGEFSRKDAKEGAREIND